MSQEAPSSDNCANQIRSGPAIVSDFVAALENDSKLDKATVEAVEKLLREERLTVTNLVRLLEEARGKTSI
jgi:hypothetical protein